MDKITETAEIITPNNAPAPKATVSAEPKKTISKKKIAVAIAGGVLLTVSGVVTWLLLFSSNAPYLRGKLGIGDKVVLKLADGTAVTAGTYADVKKSFKNSTTSDKKAFELFALNGYLKQQASKNKITVKDADVKKEYDALVKQYVVSEKDFAGYLTSTGMTKKYFELTSENTAYKNALAKTLIKQKQLTVIEASWLPIAKLKADDQPMAQGLMMVDMSSNYRSLLVQKKSISEITTAIKGKQLLAKGYTLSEPSPLSARVIDSYPAGRTPVLSNPSRYEPSPIELTRSKRLASTYQHYWDEEYSIYKLKVGEVSTVIKSNSGNIIVARLDADNGTQPFTTWDDAQNKANTQTKKY